MKQFDFVNVPIVEIANEIIMDGVRQDASDIHFDPTKENLKIRIRIDGILQDYATVPLEYTKNLVSRIKMIAKMNIMETRLPQDGAIKSRIGNKMLDLRVSSLPTNVGEKVVIRILDYTKSYEGLESLGFSKEAYEKINKMIQVPNGIILVTGATGSGKSTTVYSILQKLNQADVNIITVEDPIEMDITGINQVQVNSDIGLDFATVLRSILRQDPNIIMIGEIRDDETARIAVRASITGHLVLSTVHTNNSLTTIERLIDMEVERYLLGSALTGIVSQRLARQVCPQCKTSRQTNEYEKNVFKIVLDQDVNEIVAANPSGCEHCFGGYKDRIGIFEVLMLNDKIREAITNSSPKSTLRRLIYTSDVDTLLQDGLEKVVAGTTTFEEIIKIIDMENDLTSNDDFDLKQSLANVTMAQTKAANAAQQQATTPTPPTTTVKEEIKAVEVANKPLPVIPETPTVQQPKETPVAPKTPEVTQPVEQVVMTPAPEQTIISEPVVTAPQPEVIDTAPTVETIDIKPDPTPVAPPVQTTVATQPIIETTPVDLTTEATETVNVGKIPEPVRIEDL